MAYTHLFGSLWKRRKPKNGKAKLIKNAKGKIKNRFNSRSIEPELPDKIAQGKVTYITM